MDFTIGTYESLINVLKRQGFSFQTFESFITKPKKKAIIIRHDIDKVPANALKTAQLEHVLGIPASYYFRAVPESWDGEIMRKIVALRHELGYHYEDLALAKGDTEKAIQHFENRLTQLRQIYPVQTICMHGSPLSRHDNSAMWQKYDYREFGIIGEPYFDVDYTKVFYLTDTGRQWNSSRGRIRDRVDSGFDIQVKTTGHLMELAREGRLPDRMMINTHPQRWTDSMLPWIKELVLQNIKNQVKRLLIRVNR